MPQTETVNSIAQLVDVAEAKRKRFDTRIWWRGQSALKEPHTDPPVEWKLRPGVYRVENRDKYYEANLLYEFQLRARTRYADCPPDTDLVGWMFLAQHFRLKTRLLDWTQSPLIALYFAVCENEDEDGAIYALSPYLLTYDQWGSDGVLLPSHEAVVNSVREAFGHDVSTDRVLPVAAKELDPRMMLQISAFTIHGVDTPIEDMLNSEHWLAKYDVPASSKKSLFRELDLVGVRESNIFPDLDRLAAELNRKRFGSAFGAFRENAPPRSPNLEGL